MTVSEKQGPKPHKKPASTLARRLRTIPGALLWTIALIAVVTVGLFALSVPDEPMRRSMERAINERLTGYTVRVPKAHFQLFGLSVTLSDVVVEQTRNPNPPVAFIPKLKASLQWRELLSWRLVSDFALDNPRIHINRLQFQKEADDSVKLKDRGWQHAAEAIYPFKINLVKLTDADLVYIDSDSTRPLRVSHLDVLASNIRNIHSKEREYPSPFHAEGVVFEQGTVVVDGNADLLAEPSPTFRAKYRLAGLPLDNLEPIADRERLTLKGGVLTSNGTVEYQQAMRIIDVNNATVTGLHADYQHMLPRAVAGIHREAADLNFKAGYTVRVDTFELVDAELGMRRIRNKHPYRLFFAHANVRVTNYSNRPGTQPADATMRGQFMGSGRTSAHVRLKPERVGPEFDLDLAIENTQLTSLNEMLRAHAKMDVTKGTLSFYSQLGVHNNRITGYVKPLVKDIKVYSWHQDKRNNVFNQLYEIVAGGLMKIFKNSHTDEVATRARIDGPVGKTSAGTWEMIGNAFENAFIKEIAPGFEKRATARRK